MKSCNVESGLSRGSGLVSCSPWSSALQTRTGAANENCTQPRCWKEPSDRGTGGRTQAYNILKHQRSAFTSALFCRVYETVQTAICQGLSCSLKGTFDGNLIVLLILCPGDVLVHEPKRSNSWNHIYMWWNWIKFCIIILALLNRTVWYLSTLINWIVL